MCTIPQLSELDLTAMDTVAIDLETDDPTLKTKGLGEIRADGCKKAKEEFETDIPIAQKKHILYFHSVHQSTDYLVTKKPRA